MEDKETVEFRIHDLTTHMHAVIVANSTHHNHGLLKNHTQAQSHSQVCTRQLWKRVHGLCIPDKLQ